MSREAIFFLFLQVIIFSIVKNRTLFSRGTGFIGVSHAILMLHVQDYWFVLQTNVELLCKTSVKVIDSFKHWIDLYEIACNKLNDLSNILLSMSGNYF